MRQSYPQWQAAVVDDASTDQTAAIVADHAAKDSRIRLVPGDGKGVSSARNIGLAQAAGTWLLFLDADDWIAPEHLASLVRALENREDAVAAYGSCSRVLPDGHVLPPTVNADLAADPAATLVRTTGVAIHSVLAERAAVVRAGGFDPGLGTCEDWDLWQRIARLGRPWLLVPEALCFYRMSEASLSRNLARLIADAATVIDRGLAADDRVPDAVAGLRDSLAGPQTPPAPEILYETAYWFAAIAAAGGGDPGAVVPLLADRPRPEDPGSAALASTLAQGTAYGLAIEPSRLAERWPDYGARLSALIAALGALGDEPGAGRRLQYRVEAAILELDDLTLPRPLGLTLGRRLDLRTVLVGAVPTAGIDRLHLKVAYGRWKGASVDLGMLGRVSRLRLAGLLIDYYAAHEADAAPWRRLPLRGARAWLRLWRRGRRFLQSRGIPESFADLAGTSHGRALAKLRRSAEAEDIARSASDPQTPAGGGAKWAEARHDRKRAAYWDDIFRDADPWNYASPYEQEKYDRQLKLLPDGPIGTVLELACAEGHFSRSLAARVGRLIATDISTAALARARERCAGLTNIEFRALNLVADPLPPDLDLIVCSEVLYFLSGRDDLAEIGAKIAAALAPGGHLLTAHAFVLSDSGSRTAFDWPNPFGAATISEVLCRTPTLVLERSLETELYRIDLFVRNDGRALEPRRETVPVTAEIEPEVARCIVPGGAVVTRRQASERERREAVPVLMYHRIAEDGPEGLARYRVAPEAFRRQLTWLRRNGFHSITAGELEWFIRHRYPIAGRPVVLTFDDGFEDFAQTAWPMLRRFDFRPEVFLVTELAGGEAEWDRVRGGAFPLMDWPTIARLHAQGASFGSHLASHRPADGLSTSELAGELLRSRARMTRWLGRAPVALAPPHGRSDGRLRRLARECGYRIVLTTRPGIAEFTSDPLDIPRLEVRGDMTLDEFTAGLERYLDGTTRP